MVIWILDCATTYCTKVNLSPEREKELNEKYDSNVEEFLNDHREELRFSSMDYVSWMSANDENFDIINY